MTLLISLTKAKTSLSKLVAQAEAGEEVVLTRRGKPVATINSRPADAGLRKHKRVLGLWDRLGPMDDPYIFDHSDPELEALMDKPI